MHHSDSFSLPLRTIGIRRWKVSIAAAVCAATAASAQIPSRITGPVVEANRSRIQVHSRAWQRFARDLGPAPQDARSDRVLLVLRRSEAQEIKLRTLLSAQQRVGSPEYHKFLSPLEFGAEFGVAPVDVAAVRDWLGSHGLVSRVSAGASWVELSGSASKLGATFGVNIHRFGLAGRVYSAGVGPPSIPSAVAPVVAGLLSLDNYPKRGTGLHRAQFTATGPPVSHQLVPGDVATIYDFQPLYAVGLDGTGVSIAVIARSNLDLADWDDFRSLFLPSSQPRQPEIVLNGPDPGVTGGIDTTETTLDSEWAGAAAPGANVMVVVSASTATTDGIDLSAAYAVDHDLADVMSISYGDCEPDMGGAGSPEQLFYQQLYEQAAAEGITVVVSAGDTGPAGCDSPDAVASGGLAVNGLASPPWVLAVGGTEFDDSGGNYWSAANSTGFASALGYIPEAAWNESCSVADCGAGARALAGGGGASIVYPKPDWQSGPGVPADGARDLPDLALAAAGRTSYAICLMRICRNHAPPPSDAPFLTADGTSAGTPVVAGLVAILDQELGGRQGLIGPTLYAIGGNQGTGECASGARAQSCAILDIVNGNTFVPCTPSSPDCSSADDELVNPSPVFQASPGYDLATGLGSVDAANLVNSWPKPPAGAATETALAVSPMQLQHGTAAAMSVRVASVASGPAPAGQVTLDASCPSGDWELGPWNLNSGTAKAEIGDLPGGNCDLVARFGGSAGFAASASNAVAVSVAPEPSSATIEVYDFVPGRGTWGATASAAYGDLLQPAAIVRGVSGVGSATGAVNFSSDSGAFAPNSLAINSDNVAAFPAPLELLAPGKYDVHASYSGDASFAASQAAPFSFTVGQASTNVTFSALVETVNGKRQATLQAEVDSSSWLGVPTGTVTFVDSNGALGTATAKGQTGYPDHLGKATAQLSPQLAPGPDTITARYSGDAGFAGADSAPLAVEPGSFHFTADRSAVQLANGQTATFGMQVLMDEALTQSTVNLKCSVPSGTKGLSCAISPGSVQLSQASPIAAATLTISLAASAGQAARFGALFVASLLMVAMLAPKRTWLRAPALATWMLITAIACAGPASSSSGGNGFRTVIATVSGQAGTQISSFDLGVQILQ